MLVEQPAFGTRAAGSVGDGQADTYFVGLACIAIVLSGTPLAVAAIVVAGTVGFVRLLSGNPIASGWIFLTVPPLVYVMLGVANGQLTTLHDLGAGSTSDFRVIALIPILLLMATHRQPPHDARRSLEVLVAVVSAGLLVSIFASQVLPIPRHAPFSSHHAVGFVAATSAITVVALPARVLPRRQVLLAISALALATSGSRSGVAAAVAGLCAVPVLRAVMGQRLGWSVDRIVRMCVATVAIGIAAAFVAPSSLQRVTDTVGSVVDSGLNAATFGRSSESGQGVSEAERNVAVRLDVWDELSSRAGAEVVFRVDPGTVDDLLSGETEAASHTVFAAHNIYLQLSVELGWLGMLAYVGLSTAGVRLLMRGRTPSARTAIGAVWVAVLAFGFTSNSLLSPAVMVPAAFFVQLLSQDPELTPEDAQPTPVGSQ